MRQVSVTQTRRIARATESDADAVLQDPEMTRILIVCDNDSDTDELRATFREAGLTSESVNNMSLGCESASSGRFQVVFSTPFLGNESWSGLIEVANQCHLTFKVILLARTFDLNQWTEALRVGAFDVLDVLCDLPKAADIAKRALGPDYLRCFQTRPRQV